MNIKLKWVVLFELLLILFLLFLLFKNNYNYDWIDNKDSSLKLLSPRIYSGVLEPKSFLLVNYAPLKRDIESYIIKNNLNVSLYVENLRSGSFIGIDERKGYPAASLAKVLTAILIMHRVECNELSLDTMIDINDSYKSNSFGSLYNTTEKRLSLRVLIEKMLKKSDDTAFITLMSLINKTDSTLFLNYFDYYSDDSVSNTKPYQDYEFGLVTSKSIYNIFSSLYLSTVLEPEHSEYILSLLTDTVFDIKKVADLPNEVIVSQKFGVMNQANELFFHSCGIIYFDESRLFFCIMTKDLEEDKASQVVGYIVNRVYNYAINARSVFDHYKEEHSSYK